VRLGGKGPVVLEHMNDAYAQLGANAEFECRVVGEPLPHITWSVRLWCYLFGFFSVILRSGYVS